MNNFIEELFYGNLEPQAMRTYMTKKLQRKLSVLCEKEERLKATLSDESKKLLNEYSEAYNEFSSLSCAENFLNGFRHGAKFTYDTFVDD